MGDRPIPRHRAGGNQPSIPDNGAPGTDDETQQPTTAQRPPAAARTRQAGAGWLILVAAAMAVGLIGGLLASGRTDSAAAPVHGKPGPAAAPGATATATAQEVPPVPPQPVSAAQLATLPAATTWGVVTGAPADPTPDQAPSGELVSPDATVPVYASPGGPAIASLPAQQLDGNHQPVGQTSVPVITTQRGWAQVLLPSKPNSSTGWIFTDDPHVSESVTPWLIRVDREHFTLTLERSGAQVGQWTVGVGMLQARDGQTQSVTPAGRTFVIADIKIVHPTYSPIILPLGVHSPIYDEFGGGPATVGLHTWTPSSAVYGQASSNGCIRVPADALAVLSTQVPIGTPVLIR